MTMHLERLDDVTLRIPRSTRPGMLVDGLIFADERLEPLVRGDRAAEQVANVAFLPGIQTASLAMPDIHWGYGFCIGGVCGTDPAAGGVVSPGGVGYDINCGVRLVRTNLTLDDVRPLLVPLVNQLMRDIPVGVGQGGKIVFSPAELRQLMREGIACFASPSRPQALAHPSNYYGWMLCGEALYGALEACGYPLADGPPQAEARVCFETFPHGITVVAHRGLGLGPALARQKGPQRRALLERCGVHTAELRGIDWIDAALCALAAQRLSAGAPCRVYGAAASGVVLLPSEAAW